MKKYGIIGIVFVGVAVICAFTFRGHKEADYLLTDFPAEADPVTVGNKIADRFLEQWHSQYGSPLRVDEPRTQITYPDVCTWLGGLWFAQATKNRGLEERLEARFQPLFTTEAYLQPQANHVDNNVFGAVPLELYMQTKDEKYLAMGMKYADTQWDAPATQELTEEEKQKYLDLASVSTDKEIQDANLEQTYAMEFLWNKVGSYATKEGVTLKWDVSSTGVNNKYTLNFTTTGSYVGVISYIYALENDSDLAFRIENFKMTASGENVTATFTVNNVAIKAETVSGSSSATSANTTVQ